MSTRQGYYGTSYDRYAAHNEQSTIHKMKETYWTTKQAVIKKLGKKEDEHVVASDSELDAKIEVFKAIQLSSMELLRAIEKYQDRLCTLSQEENGTGRFLKTNSQLDKTRAGKMMGAVGKSLSFSSQQRLALRVPLVRLYQEVETFRYRAISDTLMTINRMEGARTEYRGALLWMKDISEELDPDTYKQLEKFRKVQAQVRKTKARFDKLKLDTMQKIDLLAASRCNMFSHVLANYQSTLLHFWEKTARTMSAVAESFKGYQYYEFNMLKDLVEPSKKLLEQTGAREIPERDTDDIDERDSEEYEEDEESEEEEDVPHSDDKDVELLDLEKSEKGDIEEMLDLLCHDTPERDNSHSSESQLQPLPPGGSVPLIPYNPVSNDNETSNSSSQDRVASDNTPSQTKPSEAAEKESRSRLISFGEGGEAKKKDDQGEGSMTNLLEAIDKEIARPVDKSTESQKGKGETSFIDFGEDTTIEEIKRKQDEEFDFSGKILGTSDKKEKKKKDASAPKDLLSENYEPEEVDKDDMTLLNEILNAPSTGGDDFTREWQAVFGDTPLNASANFTPVESDQPRTAEFMPSNLLDMTSQMATLNSGSAPGPPSGKGAHAALPPTGAPSVQPPPKGPPQAAKPPKGKPTKKGQKQDMSAWFNLFADLDPLANPDAIGKSPDEMTDA